MLNADVRADAKRIYEMLDSIATISETSGADGVTRLAYTRLEREAHALVSGWLSELGLEIRTDAAGNTIAELAGEPGYPAIGLGSHLDSVPHGGRFDGIVGAVAGVEIVRLISMNEIAHKHPVRVVMFAGEEGARFGHACIGSKAAAGMWSPASMEEVYDAGGSSLGQAMRSIGMDPARIGEAAWSRDDWAGFIEVHVEQGQVLEASGCPIGVVDLISGSTRLELRVTGQAAHSGGTPMGALRQDALAAAAEVVLLAERIASDTRHRGTRCTVGRLEVWPGSITTIPGEVRLSVDVRDVDGDRQRVTADEIVRLANELCTRRGVQLNARLLADASPVVMPVWIRDVITDHCRQAHIDYRVICSGASHDSQMIGRVIPAGLVFVPSHRGISHSPEEWTEPSHIARGVDVVLHSLLALDQMLTLDESDTS